ncbi:MFS transporter [Bacillus sp. ISL-4]|uniref:MFS transporter n=1 Tax=Bacillus sp. ISL-4 TaxID=2819125 RepID=UPI001BE8A17C|nr:MFS transporter [Bacillus sp. ISL-4]MBT2669014.1 MFS transporter [Bacillus sp. ISL-4]MBT2671359.1 MFS transporter [Streptomyces sp. ISL-14]
MSKHEPVIKVEHPTSKKTLPWYRGATKSQWHTFWAAFFGWTLDVMDLMLYSMVIVYIMKDLQMTQSVAGIVASATLIASALGGIVFGFVADKWGRKKSMIWSILIYSGATVLCGFSETANQLMVFRMLVGFGMGGEWSAGAALVIETWPAKHRSVVMAFVQSGFAVGYALAALISAIVIPIFGWNGVFFVGVLPALLTLWVRKHTPESQMWQNQSRRLSAKETTRLIIGNYGSVTLVCISFTMFAMLGYWGLFTWLPTYLSTPIEEGGPGLDVIKTSAWVIVSQIGAWLGYILFGFIASKIGKKSTFIIFFSMSAVSVPLYLLIKNELTLLFFGMIVAFFGTGYHSGFAPTFSSLYPTEIRATAQGVIYNVSRGISAFAPFIIGYIAMEKGLSAALMLTGGFFAISSLIVLFFLKEPEGLIDEMDL